MTYSRILSYLLLSACAFWAISQCEGDISIEFWCCSNIGFSLVCVNGFLGLWHCSRSSGLCSSVVSAFKKKSLISGLSFFTYIYSVPLIIVDIYLYYMFNYKVAFVHLFYPLCAFIPRLAGCNKKESVQMIDLIILLHVGSITTVSAMMHNYFGIAAGITLAISHFFISAERKILSMESRTVQNYLMSLFLIFAFRALVDAEKEWILHCSQGKDSLSAC